MFTASTEENRDSRLIIIWSRSCSACLTARGATTKVSFLSYMIWYPCQGILRISWSHTSPTWAS